MKTLKTSLFLLSLLVVTACNDESESTSLSSAVSNDEAAEMIAISLAEDASGMTVVVSDAAYTADEAIEGVSGGRIASCGYSWNTSMSKTNPTGTLIAYSYDYNYNYLMACDSEEVPMSLTANVSYSGYVDAPRLASEHSGAGDLSVSALDSATVYVVNGSYTSSGSFQSKIRNKNSHTSSIEILIDGISVNKINKEIISGTATVSIKGEVPGRGGFSFDGTVVFNGNGTATVTIAADTYTIDLESGEVEG